MLRLEFLVSIAVAYAVHAPASSSTGCDTTYGQPCLLRCVFPISDTRACWSRRVSTASGNVSSLFGCLHLVSNSPRRETTLRQRYRIGLRRATDNMQLTFYFESVHAQDLGDYVCEMDSHNLTVSLTATNETYQGQKAAPCVYRVGDVLTLVCRYAAANLSDFYGCWTKYQHVFESGLHLLPTRNPCLHVQHPKALMETTVSQSVARYSEEDATISWQRVGKEVVFSLHLSTARFYDRGIYECSVRHQKLAYFNVTSPDSYESWYDFWSASSGSQTSSILSPRTCTIVISDCQNCSSTFFTSLSSPHSRSRFWTLAVVSIIFCAAGAIIMGCFLRRRYRRRRASGARGGVDGLTGHLSDDDR